MSNSTYGMASGNFLVPQSSVGCVTALLHRLAVRAEDRFPGGQRLPLGVLQHGLRSRGGQRTLQVDPGQVEVLVGQDVEEQRAVLGEVVVHDLIGRRRTVDGHGGEQRRPDHRVHREQEGEGQQQREAPTERVHAGLPVELHLLLLELLLVVLVLLLQLLQLGLERLHVLHALDLLEPEGQEHEADQDRQDHDRRRVVGDDRVDLREAPPEAVQQVLPRCEGEQVHAALDPCMTASCAATCVGTRSIPPAPNGLHRRTRQAPRATPLTTPWARIASSV